MDSNKLAELHLKQMPAEQRTLEELRVYYKKLQSTGVSTSTLAALIADQEFAILHRESTKMANATIARAMRR